MALVESTSYSHNIAIHGSRDSSSLSGPVLPYSSRCPEREKGRAYADQFDLASELEGISSIGALDCLDTFGFTLRGNWSDLDSTDPGPAASADDSGREAHNNGDITSHSRGPFRKWMRSLHRRACHRSSILKRQHRLSDWSLSDPSDPENAALNSWMQRRASSSQSSFRFVAAVRSASVSLASVSSVTRSRRNTRRSGALSRTDRSSRASASVTRVSEDSAVAEKVMPRHDAAATERALQRRRVLEEIIATEESYIGDVRFLINVYVTILASLPSQAVGLRSSINRNLTDIVELHEEILGELHRAVPNSEYTQSDTQPCIPPLMSQSHTKLHGHRRWRSLDAVPEHDDSFPLSQDSSGLLADPQVAADVAGVFGKRMNRFFIYKEYGAKYDMMTTDIDSIPSSISNWELYQKGLEALASTVASAKSNTDTLKKSLTLRDLLMKPVQRICKYPLLFSELLKYTTVTDSPNSHMEVESTLTRLREATAEINRATDDAQVRATLEKTWLLQDRLVFPHRELDAVTRTRVRSFGRVHLCGALHICWHGLGGVQGQYMISLLYQDVLCLASAGKVDPIYTIMACINLNGAKVEEVDNGRGLQCHTAPFSWKLIFECDCEMYELLMTACSSKEEDEWRSRLARLNNDDPDPGDTNIFSMIELKMKSLGTVFGKQGTTVRKLSINRATTVSPKAPLCQVILKNTSAVRGGQSNSSSSLTIHRSQSLLTTNSRLPVLVPPRADRVRLETLLADVWSRDILPLPGINTRPGSTHLVRASSMMRKLSMANLAGSLNKRSGSFGRGTARPSEDSLGGPCQHLDSAGPEPDVKLKAPPDKHSDAATEAKRPRILDSTPSSSYNVIFDAEATDIPETSRDSKARKEVVLMSSLDMSKDDLSTQVALRKSSANSVRLVEYQSPEKTTGAAFDKENTCEDHESKGLNRWAKVGNMAKGGGRGRVLRNFFR